MSKNEAFGELVSLAGFDLPDLAHEQDAEHRTWYTVVLGAGAFATRAYSEDFALLKTEIRADELRNGKNPIETNGGFPLVMRMSEDEASYRDKTWFEGKSESELVSLRENGKPIAIPQSSARFNPYQERLFKIHELC